MERFKSCLNRRKISNLAALAGIIIFYVFLEGIGITCPILFLTGVSCAGCGMSRAWLSLFSGNISLAFSYHPLFWMPPFALLVWLLQKRIPKNVLTVLLWGGCGLFLTVYIVRMINPLDTVVVFHPMEGFIGRTVVDILEFLRGLCIIKYRIYH